MPALFSDAQQFGLLGGRQDDPLRRDAPRKIAIWAFSSRSSVLRCGIKIWFTNTKRTEKIEFILPGSITA